MIVCHAILNTADISFLSKLLVGPTVLKTAHIIDSPITSKNYCHGKKNCRGISTNSIYYMVIVNPTRVPIKIPSKLPAITSIKASYM